LCKKRPVTSWAEKRPSCGAEDHRGLTPAIHARINPYGRFDADLSRHIDLDLPMAA